MSIAVLSASAQVSFDESKKKTAEGPMTKFQLDPVYAEISVVDAGKYMWVRTSEIVDAAIETAVCDNAQCWPADVDSAEFTMEANSSFDMSAYFYPNNSCGNGEIVVKVYKVDDPSQTAEVTFNGEIWCTNASLTTLNSKPSLRLSPSPATQYIDIHTSRAGSAQIVITDILGNELFNTDMNSIAKRVDISSFNQGIYFISYRYDNQVINKSFMKK